MRNFIYVLRLVDRLRNEANWTEKDNGIVHDHFSYLQSLLQMKKLVLAGKTDGLDENTFGIVIFTCEDMDEAKIIMENDPAVKNQIMNATLYPYTIALRSSGE